MRTTIVTTLAVTLMMQLAATSACAATLQAGPLRVTAGQRFGCYLVNTSRRALEEVVVKIHTTDGPALQYRRAVLAPDQVAGSAVYNPESVRTFGWCTFEFNGSRRAASATACTIPEFNGGCESSVGAN